MLQKRRRWTTSRLLRGGDGHLERADLQERRTHAQSRVQLKKPNEADNTRVHACQECPTLAALQPSVQTPAPKNPAQFPPPPPHTHTFWHPHLYTHTFGTPSHSQQPAPPTQPNLATLPPYQTPTPPTPPTTLPHTHTLPPTLSLPPQPGKHGRTCIGFRVTVGAPAVTGAAPTRPIRWATADTGWLVVRDTSVTDEI